MNPFDQFDGSAATTATAPKVNAFDQFDEPAFDDRAPVLADTGQGRLASAGNQILQSIQRGAGIAVSGVGRMTQALGDTMRAGDDAEARREMQMLSENIGRAQRLDDPAERERLTAPLRERYDYLRDMSGQMRLAGLQPVGEAIQQDAATRFPTNPAYSGEFLADTVPQVAGGAIQSVAPFLVHPGIGVNQMFAQTFDQTVQENLDRGVPEDEAIRRGLRNGIVSGGLESVGDGIVAGALSKLALGRGTALRGVAQATAAEGVTGAMQEAAGQIIDEQPLDAREIAKQGALEALGGLMLGGGAAAVGKVLGRRDAGDGTRSETNAFDQFDEANPEVTLGEEGTPMREDPLRAPQQSDQRYAPPPAAAQNSEQRTVDMADPAVRQRLVREYSFPAGMLDDLPADAAARLLQSAPGTPRGISELQAAMRVAEEAQKGKGRREKREAAPPKATALTPAAQELLNSLENGGSVPAFITKRLEAIAAENGVEILPSDRPENVIQKLRDKAATGTDVPFSATPPVIQSDTTPGKRRAEIATIRSTIKTMERGWQGAPGIAVHETVAQSPESRGGKLARQHSARGAIVEAWTEDGRVHLVADGIAQVAAMRGIPAAQRAREVLLHEAVGHYGVGGVLRGKARKEYQSIVDGALARMPQEQRTELARSYGFDLANENHRAALAEEYLARLAEPGVPTQTWVRQLWARLRELLRQYFPGMDFTDGDLALLLRRGLERMKPVDGGVRFALTAYHGTPHTVDRFQLDKMGTGEGAQVYGWGLYFAEEKRVAESYQKALSPAKFDTDSDDAREAYYWAIDDGIRGPKQTSGGMLTPAQAIAKIEAFTAAPPASVSVGQMDKARRALKYLRNGGKIPNRGTSGNTYTVELDVEREDLLDWDKPLEKQGRVGRKISENLKSQLHESWLDELLERANAEVQELTGRELVQFLQRVTSESPLPGDVSGGGHLQREVSEYLQRVGIPGLRYLDKGSRDAKQGTYNYVIWDESKIKITHQNGQPVSFAEAMAAQQEASGNAEPAPQFSIQESKPRKFSARAEQSPAVAPIAARLESIYQPITNEATLAEARTRIDELGIDRALAEVLATGPSNPPTALSNTMGIELMARLQAVHRYEETAALVEHIAAQATTQGQAIQALSLLSRLTPEGIQLYAQRLVLRAQREGGASPEVQQMAAEIARLQKELAAARWRQATAATLDLAKEIEDSTKLTPERKQELLEKIRESLLLILSDSNAAKAKLVQLGLDAGMNRDAATRLAKRVIESFLKKQKTARATLLKQMLARATREGTKATVPKGLVQQLTALNEEGMLTDEQMVGKIGAKLGVPIFTKAHAEKIAQLQRAYAAAPEGDVKLAAAAEMITAVHQLVPLGMWTKLRFFRQLIAVLNPKTLMRNLGGNQFLAILNVPIDALKTAIDAPVSFVTGKRTRTGIQARERLRGLFGTAWRDYKTGRDHAASKGQVEGVWRAGVKHMLTMARITQRGVFDDKGLNGNYGAIFSQPLLRMMENTYTLLAGSTDRAFHQSTYLAALERKMQAEKRNTGARPVAPTPEMIQDALMEANAAIYQDDSIASGVLKRSQSVLNLPRRDPVTGGLKWDREFGLGNVVTMFASVPGNLLQIGAELSPLSLIRGFYDSRHAVFQNGQFNQENFNDMLARTLVGSAVIFAGYWLARLGILVALPEEDPDREAMRQKAGLGQYRINAGALWRRMLSGDWTTPMTAIEAAEDDDPVYDFAWAQPVSIPLAMGAQIAQNEAGRERAATAGKTINEFNAMVRVGLSGVQTLEAQPMMSGLVRFLGNAAQRATAQHPEGGMVDAIWQAVTEDLPKGFIPTLVRQTAQYNDNIVRETRATPIMALGANLPGVSEQFPPRYDVLGEMQERYQYGTNTLWNVFANPVFKTRVNADPVLRELDALYERTGEGGVLLRQPQRSVTMPGGRRIELTNDERSELQRLTGTLQASMARELIASPAWARLPDEARVKVMANRLSAAGNVGKHILFREQIRNPSGDDLLALRHARARGLR